LIPSLALPSAAALPIEVWDAEFLAPDADGGDMPNYQQSTPALEVSELANSR